jgi:membrane associated rhomboid family serine protease
MISNFNTNKAKPGAFTQIIELISEIPFFVRFILLTNITLFILNIFIPHISFYLSNIPFFITNRYQFWRLITTSFITTNLINMFLGLFVWIRDAISLENSLGTIRYIFIFIFNSTFINLIYVLLYYLLFKNNFGSSYYNYVHKVNNSGIWPIIICEITLLCFNNPDSKIKFLSLPSPLKAKYYPFIIIILLILINNFRVNLEIVSGFIYGIIYFYLLQNKFNISEETTQKLEKSCCFRCLIGFHGFMIINKIHNVMNSGEVNIIGGAFGQNKINTNIGDNNDYMAVNEQNNNSNTLDEINTNTDNKN